MKAVIKTVKEQRKFSQKLTEQIKSVASDTDVLDVVVELEQQAKTQKNVAQASSRTAQIAARKDSFARTSSPVENAISQAGGEVTEKAWINRTLRAKLPAKSLQKISELREVEKLDAPRGIEPDVKD